MISESWTITESQLQLRSEVTSRNHLGSPASLPKQVAHSHKQRNICGAAISFENEQFYPVSVKVTRYKELAQGHEIRSRNPMVGCVGAMVSQQNAEISGFK